jgi:pimeloyl-ACP methyl ester carboxylesterase
MQLRYISLHGNEIGYRLAGEGPALLLIHGMAGSSWTWRKVMPQLARRYTVLAPDLLGHGQSAKPPGDYSLGAHASGLRDLLLALDLPSVTVVGQSLGGGVAMQLAYQHPEFCERLVLVGSGGLGRDVNWILRALALPGAEYVIPVAFAELISVAGRRMLSWFDRQGFPTPHLEEMWHAYSSLVDVETRQAFIRTLRAVVDPGGQAISGRNRFYLTAGMPTLLMWGDRDPIIPVQHAYDAHNEMPGSRLEIFPGVGHFPHVEDPQRFAEVLTDFIDSTEPARIDEATRRERLSQYARTA